MRGGRRGAMNTSRSRTGVEEPITSVAPCGRKEATSRATRPSNGSSQASSNRSAAWRARRSASRQASIQRRSTASIDNASRSSHASAANNSGSTAIRRSAWPSGSGLRWSRSNTMSASARVTSRWVARVVGIAPTCRTTSGGWLASQSSSPIKSWPADSARPACPASRRNPDSGSARTGHPRSVPSANNDRLAGGSPAPSAITPRRPAWRSRNAPSAVRAASASWARPAPSGATRRVQRAASCESGTSGSSKGALMCTGPGGLPVAASCARTPASNQASASPSASGTGGSR